MDETLAKVALDLSGRPCFVFNVTFSGPTHRHFPVELVEEFFRALATNAKMNLHITVPYGTNNHHIAEAIFKATAAPCVRPSRKIPATTRSRAPRVRSTDRKHCHG